MFGKVLSSCIVGIEGKEVIVEADYGDGLPAFEMVGFLGSEVREARERVKAALKNSAVFVPPGRLTVNLSPADLRKQGNSFDLPIAIAILTAIGIIPQDFTEDYLFTGELALDGTPAEVFSRVEIMRSLGLDVPAATETLWELRRAGIDVPLDALTPEACAELLAPLFK